MTAGSSGASVSGISLRLASTNTKIPAVTTTANATGNYAFLGVAAGTYWVTPQSTTLTFAPTTLQVAVTNANVAGINFVASATPTTQHIYGQVTTTSSGVNIVGITVNLYDGTSQTVAATTTTGSTGSYGFMNVAPGTYTVAAQATGLTFAPASQAVTVSNAYVQGVNFVASSAAISGGPHVSGTVTYASSGAPVAGIALSFEEPKGTIAYGVGTASDGTYYCIKNKTIPPGTYWVIPISNTLTFAPAYQFVTLTNTDVTGVNFKATPMITTNQFYGVLIAMNPGTQVGGISVSLQASTSLTNIRTTTTAADGSFSFSYPGPGAYRIVLQYNSQTTGPPVMLTTLTGTNAQPMLIPVTAKSGG